MRIRQENIEDVRRRKYGLLSKTVSSNLLKSWKIQKLRLFGWHSGRDLEFWIRKREATGSGPACRRSCLYVHMVKENYIAWNPGSG
jgi:hypothetical protein